MRCASTGPWSARRRRCGACCAVTPGATGGWTTRDRRHLEPAPSARGRPSPRPRLAAHDPPPPLGVGDRHAHGARADPARAARDQADPLHADAAEARAGDEGDPAEVQARQAAPAGRADEVLPRDQGQSRGVVPAARAPTPGLLRALLRAEGLLEASAERVTLVDGDRPRHLGSGDLALVGIRAARHLRREPDGVHLLHGHDDGQDTADDPARDADRVRVLHRAFPDGARPLLDDDEPLGRRPGPADAEADPEDVRADAAETLVAQRTDPRTGNGGRRACEGGLEARPAGRAASGQAQEADSPPVTDAEGTDDLTVEASG